jgi:predicted acetyltransferase
VKDVKLIISKIFLLVEKTSYDEFIKEANDILKECVSKLDDFAKDIALFIQNWYKIYMEKDLLSFKTIKAKDYRPNYAEIARGTISIFETLIHFVRHGNEEITKIL